MKYINLFDTQAAYDAAEKYYPNVSYIEATDEVVYQEISPEPHSGIIVAKFTTTSANQNVKITNKQQYFSSIAVDGEPLTIGTGALNHTFASAGKHIVEYKALDTTLIPINAFSDCTGLTSVTIPDSVTSIGNYALSGCNRLTSVTIPNSVTTIGDSAFQNCDGLTSVTIGNSVTTIGDYAFEGCSGLTSIVVENGNTKYDSRDNCNAIIETATNTLIAGCNNTIIPNSVTTIGNNAFLFCSGLTSITIPESVTSIGDYAFSDCTGLTSITSLNTTPPTLGTDVFRNVPEDCPIYVPDDSVSEYSDAYGWSDRDMFIQPIQ